MRSIVTQIELKDGVRVNLRCTPAVYGIAKEKGFAVSSDLTSEKALQLYIALAYCAAINEWQIHAYDDPNAGEFPYTYADFDAWAWSDQESFIRFVNFFIEALSGKTVAELARDNEKKKKVKKSRFGWTMNRSKNS